MFPLLQGAGLVKEGVQSIKMCVGVEESEFTQAYFLSCERRVLVDEMLWANVCVCVRPIDIEMVCVVPRDELGSGGKTP